MGSSSAFAPGLQVSSRMVLRRRRELPLAGEILVRTGDTVSGDQCVARAQLEGELRIVRLAEMLGVLPAEIAVACKVAVGDAVALNQVLAEVKGLWGFFRTTVVAPIVGVVEFMSTTTGHIGIRAAPQVLELTAYIPGSVVESEPNRSITIESVATFVQGIFGVGGERIGQLTVLPIPGGMKLEPEHVPEQCSGAVLIGGHSPSIAAIRKAVDGGAVGLVTGSIDDPTLRDYIGYDLGIALTGDEAVPMTLIITEGFGSIPMSSRILSALAPVNGSRVSINGATQVRAGAQRPEVIVWASAKEGTLEIPEQRRLEVGAHVRLIRVPFFGLRGTIVALPHELVMLETGAMARVLRAQLDDGREVVVPRANVELE